MSDDILKPAPNSPDSRVDQKRKVGVIAPKPPGQFDTEVSGGVESSVHRFRTDCHERPEYTNAECNNDEYGEVYRGDNTVEGARVVCRKVRHSQFPPGPHEDWYAQNGKTPDQIVQSSPQSGPSLQHKRGGYVYAISRNDRRRNAMPLNLRAPPHVFRWRPPLWGSGRLIDPIRPEPAPAWPVVSQE